MRFLALRSYRDRSVDVDCAAAAIAHAAACRRARRRQQPSNAAQRRPLGNDGDKRRDGSGRSSQCAICARHRSLAGEFLVDCIDATCCRRHAERR